MHYAGLTPISLSGKYLVDWDPNNFAPRLGLAWRPFHHDRTVIRAGLGVFYGSPYANNQTVQLMRLGFGGAASFRNPVPFVLREGVPLGALRFPAEQDLVPEFGAIGTRWEQQFIEFFEPHRHTPYSLEFNLTIGQEVKDMAFEVAYLANLGRKIGFPSINIRSSNSGSLGISLVFSSIWICPITTAS